MFFLATSNTYYIRFKIKKQGFAQTFLLKIAPYRLKNWHTLLFKNKRLRRFLEKTDKYKTAQNPTAELDLRLLTKLKILRKELASKNSVPAFIIFTDATLVILATNKPTDEKEFLKIPGISERKYEKYGTVFLKLLNNHLGKTVENNNF